MAHQDDKNPMGDPGTDAASMSQKAPEDDQVTAVFTDDNRRKPSSGTIDGVSPEEYYSRRDPWWDPQLEDTEENKRWTDKTIFGGQVEVFLQELFWTQLVYDVHGFASYCLPQSAPWSSLDADRQTRIKAWAPKAERFITQRVVGGGSSLFAAWVWRILYDNLFSLDCEDKWNGDHWAAFGKTGRSLRERVTTEDNLFNHSYHSWRCQSVHLLYTRHGSHTDPERLRNILLEELGPIIQLKGGWNESQSNLLSDLVNSAVKVDLCILAATPNIVVELHDPQTRRSWGFPFRHPSREMNSQISINSFRMEDEEDGHPVDFITDPLLRIFGETCPRPERNPVTPNSQQYALVWRHYDQCGYVSPMRVAVDQFPDEPAEGQ